MQFENVKKKKNLSKKLIFEIQKNFEIMHKSLGEEEKLAYQ